MTHDSWLFQNQNQHSSEKITSPQDPSLDQDRIKWKLTPFQIPVLDSCVPSPCLNGGQCHQVSEEKFTCECPVQFKGHLCQCKSQTCLIQKKWVCN